MTDTTHKATDDLVKRYDVYCNADYSILVEECIVGEFVYHANYTHRIEELEAENKLLRDAVYIDDLTVTMQANDKSTALTGIGRALGFLDADMPVEAKTALRTTLAELKGQDDE